MGVKLVKVEVKRYRSIYDEPVVLELADGMNALVAPNNVGKSNLLRAIALAFGEDYVDGFSQNRDAPAGLLWARPSVTLTFRVHDPVSQREKTLLRYADSYERSAVPRRRDTYANR